MAYYYIKTTGTATGDAGRYATKQTGSFAGLGVSGYYDTIDNAINEPTTEDDISDIYCVSDVNDHQLAGFIGAGVGQYVIMSVSDTAIDTYSRGASETTTGNGDDINFRGDTYIGFDYAFGAAASSSDYTVGTGPGGSFIDCTFTNSLTTNYWNSSHSARFYNCTFTTNTNGLIRMSLADGWTYFQDCTFIGTGTGQKLIVDGTGRCDFYGCDISDTSFDEVGAISVTTATIITFEKCLMPATWAWNSTVDPSNKGTEIVASQCSSSSAAAEYQYHYELGGANIDSNTTFYRDNSTGFAESGQKISLKCTFSAEASWGNLLYFPMPTFFAPLSGASQTIRIYILSSTTLTDADVSAYVTYMDGTNKQTPNNIDTEMTNPLVAGTTLSTNTEAWTGRTAENRYHIDVDTSVDVGMDCTPIVNLICAKPSVTIYFCPTMELV